MSAVGKAPAFLFPRGAPITIDLVIEDAGAIDPASVTAEMRLKPASGGLPPAQTVPAIANFDVQFLPAMNGEKACWRGTIAGAATRAIKPGDYVTDAQLSIESTVIAVTRPALVRIQPSVTPDAAGDAA